MAPVNEQTIEWLREDMQAMKKELIIEIRSLRKEFQDFKGDHESNCPARIHHIQRKPTSTSMQAPAFAGPKMVAAINFTRILGPWVVAAALGLMGIGAHLSGQEDTTMLKNQIEAIQKALEGGGQ